MVWWGKHSLINCVYLLEKSNWPATQKPNSRDQPKQEGITFLRGMPKYQVKKTTNYKWQDIHAEYKIPQGVFGFQNT